MIEVEDPLPIAKYQPLGKDPEPLEPEVPVSIEVTDNGDGTYTLHRNIEVADGYQWYAWSDGSWGVVKGALARTSWGFRALPGRYIRLHVRLIH